MDIITWIVLLILVVLIVYQTVALKKLKKESVKASSLLNDLAFAHSNSMELLAIRVAGIHYDLLERSGRIVFFPHTSIKETLSKPGAREILIKRKIIRKKDKGPFKDTLEERARKNKLSLLPILIDLNDLECES